MKIRLRLFGDLPKYFGRERLEMDLAEGATLRELWDSIFSECGDLIPQEYWDSSSGRFSRSVMVICQGVEITGNDCALSDGEELFFLPPMVGGACLIH